MHFLWKSIAGKPPDLVYLVRLTILYLRRIDEHFKVKSDPMRLCTLVLAMYFSKS